MTAVKYIFPALNTARSEAETIRKYARVLFWEYAWMSSSYYKESQDVILRDCPTVKQLFRQNARMLFCEYAWISSSYPARKPEYEKLRRYQSNGSTLSEEIFPLLNKNLIIFE